MAGTPLLDRPTSPPKPPPDEPRRNRRDRWFAVIVVLFLLAAAALIGLATGARWFATPLAPDDGIDTQQEPAADEPAADEPAQEPAEEPADEPADKPADNAPSIRYREELRANWDVTGVAGDDVLNVRAGPGVAAEIVATLPPDTVELESTGRIADVGAQLWREIVVPGDGGGWVNAAYLTET